MIVLKLRDGHYRPKHFLAPDAHRWRDSDENRRLEELTSALPHLPSSHELCTLAHRVVDELLDLQENRDNRSSS